MLNSIVLANSDSQILCEPQIEEHKIHWAKNPNGEREFRFRIQSLCCLIQYSRCCNSHI